MFKTSNELTSDFRENMRGGNGTVEVREIFTDKELGGKCRFFAELTFPVGASIGMHRHTGEEEAFYIRKGTGLVTEDGAARQVKAGDAVLTKSGSEHSVENNGTEPLELLAVIMYTE